MNNEMKNEIKCTRCIYRDECPYCYEGDWTNAEDWFNCEDYVPLDDFEMGLIEYERDLKERYEYYTELLREEGWEE